MNKKEIEEKYLPKKYHNLKLREKYKIKVPVICEICGNTYYIKYKTLYNRHDKDKRMCFICRGMIPNRIREEIMINKKIISEKKKISIFIGRFFEEMCEYQDSMYEIINSYSRKRNKIDMEEY
jgi:hypothetical protein